MKIAIIASGFLPLIDGVTVSGMQRLKKLSQWGHEVILFCPDYSSLETDYPNWRDYTGNILPGVRVVNLASSSFLGIEYEPNVTRSSYQIVLKELEDFQPEIIHVDEPERLFVGGFWRIAGLDYAKGNNIPCVAFFRTNFLDYLSDYFPLPKAILAVVQFLLRKLIVWIYNSYDLTLVTSKVTYPKVKAMGIKNARYNNFIGLDRDRFKPDSIQADFFESHYGLTGVDSLVKIIFLGRLYPDKGWDFTLDAFESASEIDLSKVAFIVAGDGPMREEIELRLGKLTPKLYLLGRISPEDIPALLVNCDLHVTTSEKETRGLTILEAFAAGIPVVAPDSGGVVENIEHGSNGYLYTPGDRLDFLTKLKTLIENDSLRESMGDRASASVEEYDWSRVIGNLVNIWLEAINQSTLNSQQSIVNSQQLTVNNKINH